MGTKTKTKVTVSMVLTIETDEGHKLLKKDVRDGVRKWLIDQPIGGYSDITKVRIRDVDVD